LGIKFCFFHDGIRWHGIGFWVDKKAKKNRLMKEEEEEAAV